MNTIKVLLISSIIGSVMLLSCEVSEMDIPIIPGPTHANQCPACFNVNETPNSVVASVTGIEVGNLWDDTFPAPPNGTYVLQNQGACMWEGAYVEKGYTVFLQWFAAAGDFGITLGGVLNVFIDLKPPCSSYFENDIIGDPVLYRLGKAQVVCTRAYSPTSESQHIAELVGLQQDADTVFDFVPVDADGYHIRFSRPRSEVNILIHFEH